MTNKIRNNAWNIVFKALFNGREIEYKNCLYCFENGKIYEIPKSYYIADEDNYWYLSELTLNLFLKICEDMSEEDLVCLAASNVLTEMKKKRRFHDEALSA